mgnify:CR=1 FL=1
MPSLKGFSCEACLVILSTVFAIFSLISKGGVDIWVQTLVHLGTYLIFTIYILHKINKYQVLIVPKSIFFLLIFAGLCLVSILSYNKYNSEIEFFNWVNLLLFFCISLQIENSNVLEKLFILPLYVFLLILSAVFFCSEVLRLFYLPQHIIFNPNVFAALSCMFVFVGMRYYAYSANIRSRIIWLLSITFLVLMICFAKSESALFSLIAVAMISIFSFFGKRISILKYFGILLLVILAILTKASESGDRLNWWFTAIRMFLMRPLTGIGVGNFYKYAYQYNMEGLHSLYAHNWYLQLFAEGGVILGFPVIIFFIEVLRQIRDKFIFSAILVMLLNNIVEYSLSIFSIGLVFFFMVGYAFRRRVHVVNLGKFKSTVSFLVIVAFVLLTYYNVKLFIANIYLARGEYYLKVGQSRSITLHELNLAEKMFNKHLSLKSFSSAGHYNLSCVYMNKFILQRKNLYLYKAIGHMEKAIQLENRYAGNYIELFQIFKFTGNIPKKLYIINKLQRLNVRWELLKDLFLDF